MIATHEEPPAGGSRTPRGRLTALLRWASWRAIALVVVCAAGWVAFEAGAEVSERPGIHEAGHLAMLYYTLGLFVLGGLDIGIPSGGPEWAQALLWFAFFAAPAITTSALVEAVLRAVRPHALRRNLNGHVVVGGCGRLAMLYMRRLREDDPHRPLVVIERSVDNPYIQAAQTHYGARVMHADMTSLTLLDSLRLDHAHRVLLFSGDDHANLDTAARVVQLAPKLAGKVVVHVSDLRLLRVIEQRGLMRSVNMFNSYRTAARHLVDTFLLPHFHATENRDTVVLAGFGRFGQTVLHELQTHAHGLFERVVIVDRKADTLVSVFAEQVGFDSSYDYQYLSEDIHEPRTWQHVVEEERKPDSHMVYVVGSGEDSINIRTALWLTQRVPESLVVARCYRRSDFTADISRECDFHVVSTADLLVERFDANGYFEDA